MKSITPRMAWAFAIAACAAAAIYGAAEIWSTSRGSISLSNMRWELASLSVAALATFVIVYAFAWWMLLTALQRRHAPMAGAICLFLLAWPGRYAPGSVPYYGGRVALAGKLGVARPTIAASLVYENLFAIMGGGITSFAVMAPQLQKTVGFGPWMLAVLPAILGCSLLLHPGIARSMIRCGAQRVRRLETLVDHVLMPGDVLRIGATYTAGSLLLGIAYYVGLRATSVDAPLLVSIAAYNLGGIAGMLALFVPSGVGVREGVVVAVMSTVVSPPLALAAAIWTRIGSVMADFGLFALVLLGVAIVRVTHSGGPAAALTSPISLKQ